MAIENTLPSSCRGLEWLDYSWLFEMWSKMVGKHLLQFSDYSAVNALLFRKRHRYCVLDHSPPFLIEPLPDRYRMIPTVFPLEWDASFFENRLGKPCTLYPLIEAWKPYFPDETYVWSRLESESDYLYRTEILKTLPGRKLSSRRNLLHQLTREHTVSLEELTLSRVEDAQKVLKAWQAHYTEQHPLVESDVKSCQEALLRLEQSPLTGAIAYIEGEPVGFFLGERLTQTTYLMHFLKSVPSLHGLVPFLYTACAQHYAVECTWMNLEPDLGLASLRQAKQAYMPDHLLEKWEVRRR